MDLSTLKQRLPGFRNLRVERQGLNVNVAIRPLNWPSLRGLDDAQEKQAKDLLARADMQEAAGMVESAGRLRSQVKGMVNRANADTGPSKRDKIRSRKATMRAIAHQK